jgi:hypothetical protein
MKWMRVAVAGLVVGLLAGCVSTPERRISKNPALFASFPPEIQAKVRKGEIAVGFTPDMVKLALGAPRQVHVRTTAGGETELWTYTGAGYTTTMEPVQTDYWYRDRAGRMRQTYDVTWVDVRHHVEYPLMKVEFEGGKVKAIERLK